MNLKKKLSIWVLVMVLVFGLGFASVPTARTQFTLAAWEHPDEYGQGIYSITPDENSSGYWVHIESSPGFIYSTSENDTFTIDSGLSIRFDVRVFVNYTFLDLSTPPWDNMSAELHPALKQMRLNLTVTVLNNITFSIQNMTYNSLGGDLGDGVWWYSFRDILNFETAYGTIYVTTVTYEVFY
jgi:hypothetical protein